MGGLGILLLCKKEIRMKPKTAAAHMIISGASLPCRPDPLCVSCENKRHCGCFIPPNETKPGAPHEPEDWAKFTHAQIPSNTVTRTHIGGFYTYVVHTHTHTVASLESLSPLCHLLLWPPFVCPRSTPSPPLLLFPHHSASLISTHPPLSPPVLLLHSSPQSAPEWPCHVGSRGKQIAPAHPPASVSPSYLPR